VTIQFIKEHTTRDGKLHRVGEVLVVTDLIGAALVQDGFAKERKPPAPTETKETKADQKTKAAEPEEPEPEEEEPV